MSTPSRDELASRYLDQLPFEPYKVQEDALLAWFTTDQGVLVCAPTGTGKTLIAEAALFEALHTGQQAYYTTPLIALTEQKFREMQDRAVQWGFQASDVGLATGNRRENPAAPVRVVVAEILLNRLLHGEFDFEHTSAVVMDEFHSFNDPERGIVWELTLGLLPPHVRLLLLSATVGNAMDFIHWLRQSHQRTLELVRGEERRVPLSYHWVADMLLTEQLEEMAQGDAECADDAGPGLLLQSRRMLDRGRADQGQESPQRRPAGPPGRGTESSRLVARGRHQAAATTAPRRRHTPCRTAAQVSPHRGNALPTQAAERGHLHGNFGGGHQSASPFGRVAHDPQRPARQEAGDRGQRRPSDFRACRAASVRYARPRLRAGPRGRCEDRRAGANSTTRSPRTPRTRA